jgi:signal transduction histidine kinase
MRKILSSIFLIFLSLLSLAGDKWSEILANKKGQVVFYWYPNNITIDESKDIIDGVEKDLAFAFIDYLNKRYDVTIDIEWIKTSTFDEVMTTVTEAEHGVFGASSISITEERQNYLNFTPPYLSDLAVLISNANIPIANSEKEFAEIFDNLTAISIENTTLKDALLKLKSDQKLNFNLEYVTNSGGIIEKVEQTEDGFGYVDLPNFLVAFDQNSKIRRQFFYPVKSEGLGMIYPFQSDWKYPVEDYFNSKQFQLDRNEIIVRYFGQDVTQIVEMVTKSAVIGPFEEMVISNREKELQYQELLDAAKREQTKSRANNILILISVIAFLILLLLYISNRLKSKTNQILVQQQKIIEHHNHQLQLLNNEKNDLIKVLAHDLRSPLSTILNASDLLKKNKKLTDKEQQLNDFISDSSKKIESMISKILDVDAIESGSLNMKLESFDVNEVISKIKLDNTEKANKKGINVSTELAEKAVIVADRFFTAQVIHNLLSNAIKFSESEKEIQLKTTNTNNHIRIIVKDQGPGLTEEDQSKLFKKYQKLSAEPTAGESTIGLGLSIVKTYTELMKGTISFNTTLGRGTEFYVDLPKS